jgi:hypothetical protein
MSGLIEDAVSRRFGPPTATSFQQLSVRVWNFDDDPRRCKLYVGQDCDPQLRQTHANLVPIYGDSFGGFLLGNSLKISTLIRQEVWGLYRIDELHSRPEVQRALSLNPSVDYFMNAANVWYYGYKEEELYCYDAENEDIENLGKIEPALDGVIAQWLKAKATPSK